MATKKYTCRTHARMRPAIVLVLVLAGCTMTSTKMLETNDGYDISYDYHPAEGKTGVILLHMLGRTKADWKPFATELHKLSYPTIAIDLRGHGDSDGNWQKFDEDDFKAMTNDVKTASDFLASKGVTSVVVIGASIGANTALIYGVDAPEVKAMALLSPGLDYRGVKTEDAARRNTKPAFLTAARDDAYSAQSVDALSKLTKATVKIYPSGGHGTQLLTTTDLQKQLLSWLRDLR